MLESPAALRRAAARACCHAPCRRVPRGWARAGALGPFLPANLAMLDGWVLSVASWKTQGKRLGMGGGQFGARHGSRRVSAFRGDGRISVCGCPARSTTT
eukprot:2277944-Prymnesium_polylepis.2